MTDKGHAHEWHVVLPNSFQHFTFEFVSGFHHSIVLLLSAFPLPWLKAIGPIGDSMRRDSVEQLIIETLAARPAAIALHGNQRLKGFQRLNGAFEADGARFEAMLGGGLRDDGADEIVRENMRPDFLPHEFRRLAAQDVHLHRLLQRPQIEFCIPAGAVETRQIAGGHLFGVQQRGDDEDGPTAESGLLDLDARLADCE